MVFRQFDYSKNPRILYIIEEHLNLSGNLGVTIGFSIKSSTNGSDEMHICKSLHLTRVYRIEDERLRFLHVAREEVTCKTLAI